MESSFEPDAAWRFMHCVCDGMHEGPCLLESYGCLDMQLGRETAYIDTKRPKVLQPMKRGSREYLSLSLSCSYFLHEFPSIQEQSVMGIKYNII